MSLESHDPDSGLPPPMFPPAAEPRPSDYDHERPWERQPFDTERRWHAFVTYRNLPKPRTMRALHEALVASDPHGRWSLRGLERFASDDGWKERIHAYDVWEDGEWTKHVSTLLGESARERAGRHLDLLRSMQALAVRACRELLAEASVPGAKLRWSPREISRVVKEALTLERLVHGEVTERTETSVGFDLTRLSIQEVETLRVLEAKAGLED